VNAISSKFLLLFIALSMLGSVKIYTGGNLNWLILLLLLALAVGSARVRKPLNRSLQSRIALLKPYMPLLIGWVLFMVGIVIAESMNDGSGLYTIAKYIALLFVLFALMEIGVSSAQLEKALTLALALALIPLFFFVIFRLDTALVILGDGRMGWLAIWPGVLWKVGAYVWPFAVWRCLKNPEYKTFLLAFSAVLAMSLDGSRTSMLWLVLSWSVLFVISLRLKLPRRGIRTHASLAVMVIFAFGLLQPIMLNWSYGHYDNVLFTSETLKQWGARLPSIEQDSTSMRIINGNNAIRMEMLQTGWKQAIDTFPWGCGFGCNGVLANGSHVVTHMTYLQILGDGGVISLVGYMLFMLFPLYRGMRYLIERDELFTERFDVMLTPISVLLLYLFIGFLHPVSNELTEWAIVLAAISIVMAHVTRRN
jgi:hypothetical protein